MKHYVLTLFVLLGLAACQPSSPVDKDKVEIDYFRAEGLVQIEQGGSVTLSWKAGNANECLLEATPSSAGLDGPQSVDCEGSATYTPETTTTYRFSASQDGGEAVTEELTITVTISEPAESVLLTFNAFDAQDYVLEAVEGEEGVGEIGGADPVLTLTVGKRYRIINRVKTSHPFEFIDQGDITAEDTVLLSQLDADTDTFTTDPGVNFVKREDGFSFTLTTELAGEIDGYRCNFHPANMRANVETKSP